MVGGPMHEIKVPVQELWLKMLGGIYTMGGVYERHYGINQYPGTNGFACPPKDVV